MLQRAEGRGIVLERVHRADHRLQLSRLEHLPQLAHVLHLHLRLALRETAEEHADQCRTLEQQQVHGDLRDLAGGETDHQVAALPRQAAHRGLGIGTTDRVVDDVDAVAARDLLDALAQVLRRVVHQVVGADAARHRELGLAAGGGDHGGAHGLGQFDRGRADAARRAQHQHRLPGRELRALPERVVAGEVRQAHATGRGEVERGRHREQALLAHRGAPGRAVAAGIGDHAVAGLEARHALADRSHHTGQFQPGNERQRRAFLVQAAQHQQVGKIERGGAHVDQHEAGAERGFRPVWFQLQACDPGQFMADERLHRASPLVSSLRPGWASSVAPHSTWTSAESRSS
jgi:hypothetical protein